MPPLLAAMRPHQWVKNLLLLVPMLTGLAWSRPGALAQIAVAFAAFCLVASGNYLINDLLDIEADRGHADRRHRPLAAGRLQPLHAAPAAGVLIAAGIGLSLLVNESFALTLAAYLGLAILYTVILKRMLVLDVMSLAALYVLRLIAGGAAVEVTVSSWLLMFGMFFFVSLAFAKRLTELETSATSSADSRSHRAYEPADRSAFASAGLASGLVAVMVLALYVSTEEVRFRYAEPDWLWLLCPLLLYWILRIWFVALRGRLHYDPIVFATRDAASWLTAGGVLTMFALAVW